MTDMFFGFVIGFLFGVMGTVIFSYMAVPLREEEAQMTTPTPDTKAIAERMARELRRREPAIAETPFIQRDNGALLLDETYIQRELDQLVQQVEKAMQGMTIHGLLRDIIRNQEAAALKERGK